jgi:hypothetical protein
MSPKGRFKMRFRPKLSYANVMATIAVFIALGGSAYAFHLGKNSVGTKQLKKNAVTGAKVKNHSLTGAPCRRPRARPLPAWRTLSLPPRDGTKWEQPGSPHS